MSNNKIFKQFTINNLSDGMLVLGVLIGQVQENLRKFEQYCIENEKLFNDAKAKGLEVIDADVYEDIHDKKLFRQRELLCHIADSQSTSFSYIDFRKLLRKKGFLDKDLEESDRQLLNELLEIRNWTFHNPQSIVNASLEVAKREVPDELKPYVTKITPQLNPIMIERVIGYETSLVGSDVMHDKVRMAQFMRVLDLMKADYSEMYDKYSGVPGWNTVKYYENKIVEKLQGAGSNTAMLSMAIQKGKYDGTDEAYAKAVGKNDDQS